MLPISINDRIAFDKHNQFFLFPSVSQPNLLYSTFFYIIAGEFIHRLTAAYVAALKHTRVSISICGTFVNVRRLLFCASDDYELHLWE